MNTPARTSWDKVEFYTSYFLMFVLASVIGTRLAFASVWALPTIDLVFSIVALILVVASFWMARKRRSWRLWIIAFAAATQLVPMVLRYPATLFPLLGGLIPVAIMIWALVSLSRKGPNGPRTHGS
ncbi:LrgA [Dyella psychrodurans]|uniref:LrgA n=1 Tax=Dyella psychrodurans TaxID=1927960 RepID=A0A370XDB4_9GAMM|nr:LrgA [Dyella psychrodurans]RDS86398.1 LrgA [Dyella psychrodurans]